MGRAARWFGNLWSGSKEKKEAAKGFSSYDRGEARAERKRWSFRKPSLDSGDATLGQNAATAAAIEATWFKCFYAESKKEQSQHAIAVPAASSVEVRLAGNRAAALVSSFESAALRIQTAFRSYLARKALRALKALVRLQALVRGYLVRKQAAAILHGIQALIRAQATVRAQRSRNFFSDDRMVPPEIHHRRSLERLDTDIRNRRLSTGFDGAVFSSSPKIVEVDTWRPKLRPCCRNTLSAAEDEVTDHHAFTSPLPSHVPARISIPSRRRHLWENEWWTTGERCRLPATTHSTPRYSNAAATPRNYCSSSSSSPNYMVNTQSSAAKLRKRPPLSEVNLNSAGTASAIQKPAVKFPQKDEAKFEIFTQRMW